MNEKFLELAKQCGYWSGQTIEMNDVGIEKFAELIVQECITVVEGVQPGYTDYRSQIEKGMQTFCVSELKRHFELGS